MEFEYLFFASIAITAIALGFGTWLVFVRHSSSTLAYGAFASGLSLSLLCAVVYGSYRWSLLEPLRGTWTPGVLALATYATVVIYHLRAHRPPLKSTLLDTALSLLPLVLIGLLLWFMVACALGDCL